MLKKRILAFLAAAALTAALTAAVTAASPMTFRDGSIKEGIVYETCGVCPDAVIASANGVGASADLYAYWLNYDCNYLSQFMQYYLQMELDWDYELTEGQTVREYVKQDALAALKQQLVIESMCERYGLTLSEAQETELADTLAQYAEYYGGEEGYAAEVAKLGMTTDTFERVTRLNYLYGNLQQYCLTPGSELYADDAALLAYAKEQGYITADHILLKTVDETMTALDEATRAEKKALADELLAQLDASSDPETLFASLADEYSEDAGRVGYPNGYTFTTGSMAEAFEQAAYALEEGQYSGVVESEHGYHIILRRPLDEAQAIAAVQGAYTAETIAGEVESAQIRTGGGFDKLDAQALYEAITAAQNA